MSQFLFDVCLCSAENTRGAEPLCVSSGNLNIRLLSLRPLSQDTTLSAFMCLLDLLPGLFTGYGWKQTSRGAVPALWRFILLFFFFFVFLIKLSACAAVMHVVGFSAAALLLWKSCSLYTWWDLSGAPFSIYLFVRLSNVRACIFNLWHFTSITAAAGQRHPPKVWLEQKCAVLWFKDKESVWKIEAKHK